MKSRTKTVRRGSGIRIEHPTSVALSEPPGAALGRPRGDAVGAAPGLEDRLVAEMFSGLSAHGLSTADEVVLTPTTASKPSDGRRGRGEAAASSVGDVTLDVPLAAGENAVLLVERDGVFAWQLPEAPASAATTRMKGMKGTKGRRGRGAAAATDSGVATFRLHLGGASDDASAAASLGRTRAARRGRGATESLGASLGGSLAGWVTGVAGKAARVVVFKFLGRFAVKGAVRFLERNVRTGPVVIRSADPAAWEPLDTLEGVPLPTDRPARILLLVHGTFSSVHGSFGALGATREGVDFLEAAKSRYDCIIGFDHRTLNENPLENATEILESLAKLRPAHPPCFDAVSFSRGGLVLRSLTELLLPQADFPCSWGTCVFVGCTNGGTQLAEPRNWTRFVDTYTNLAIGASRAVALIPPHGAAIAPLLANAVGVIAAFVKFLATEATDADVAPGLASMRPDGEFVREINATQPGAPTPENSRYCVVAGDFDPRAALEAAGDIGVPKALLTALIGAGTNQLYGAANDLVVHTASMDDIDGPAGGFVDETLPIGTPEAPNGRVYHTVYFAQPTIASALRAWLIDGTTPPGAVAGGLATGLATGRATGLATERARGASGARRARGAAAARSARPASARSAPRRRER